MSLQVGDSMPEFSLKDQGGKWFNVKKYLGKRSMVIFFYPKDYTPGCIKEVCAFRDSYEEFVDLGAEVIGISSDSEKMHRKFASSYNLPFVLLADTYKKVRRLFKVENKLFNLMPGRETFVINKEGKVIMTFNSLNASQHMNRALKALRAC